jgi:hypothetical protein
VTLPVYNLMCAITACAYDHAVDKVFDLMLISAAHKLGIHVIYQLPNLLLTPHKFSLVIWNDVKIVEELAMLRCLEVIAPSIVRPPCGFSSGLPPRPCSLPSIRPRLPLDALDASAHGTLAAASQAIGRIRRDCGVL